MNALRHWMLAVAACLVMVVAGDADDTKVVGAQKQAVAEQTSTKKLEPPQEEPSPKEWTASEDPARKLPPLEEALETTSAEVAKQSLVVLASTQPLFFQIDVQIKGNQAFVPLMKAWDVGADKEFKRLDKDGNGRLSAKEIARASWYQKPQTANAQPTGVGRFFSKLFTRPSGDTEAAKPIEMSRERFDTLRRRESPPVHLGARPQQFDRVDRLWQIMDVARDQALSVEEWKAAGARLARLDVNGDRLIQEAELFAYDNPNSMNRAVGGQKLPPSNDFRWLSWPTETSNDWESGEQTARSLADRYNTVEKSQAMHESAVWSSQIEKHDNSGDGILDADEWLSLLKSGEVPTVAHCAVSLVPSQGPQAIEVVDGAPRPVMAGANVIKLVSEGDAGLRVWANASWIRVQGAGLSIRLATISNGFDPLQNVVNSFDGSVDKAKGYVDRQESQRQFPLNVMFDLADADKDGKLYREELVEFVAQLRDRSARSVDVSVTPKGRQLFHCLDTNGDGRVGAAERRDAHQTLGALDGDEDGQVKVTELPQVYDVTINVSQPKMISSYYSVQGGGNALPVQAVPAADAPGWFKLLDRNSDNLLERWEYPGAGPRFAKMDLDHDGIVSVAEAKKVRVKRNPAKKPTAATTPVPVLAPVK